MTPHRVQLSRKKGWTLPPLTIKVARPTRFGNPYVIRPNAVSGEIIDIHRGYIAVPDAEAAVGSYRAYLLGSEECAALLHEVRTKLRGFNLACWCALDQPCHADILLEIANK